LTTHVAILAILRKNKREQQQTLNGQNKNSTRIGVRTAINKNRFFTLPALPKVTVASETQTQPISARCFF